MYLCIIVFIFCTAGNYTQGLMHASPALFGFLKDETFPISERLLKVQLANDITMTQSGIFPEATKLLILTPVVKPPKQK